MKWVKRSLIGLTVVVVAVVIVGLLLPRSVHVERSAVIETSPSVVFALVNDYRAFNRWSPWARFDPDTEYQPEGPAGGVGARMRWHSEHPNVGSGSQEITASEANRRVAVALDFGAQGTATAYYDLARQGAHTHITWGFDTDFGNDLLGRVSGCCLIG